MDDTIKIAPVKEMSLLEEIVNRLGGTLQQVSTLDHSGRTSDKIIIEYNVQYRKN